MKTITSLTKLFKFIFFAIVFITDLNAQLCNPDTDPPIITIPCPTDTVFTVSSPSECGMIVDWTPPDFSDACLQSNLLVLPGIDIFTYYDGPVGGTGIGSFIPSRPDSFTVVGASGGIAGINRVFNACFYSYCSGSLSFDYRARMNNADGFAQDRARIMIENILTGVSTTTLLTPGNGNYIAGSLTVPVGEGDRVCFEVVSDNMDGVDSLTISNLYMTSSGVTTQIIGPKPGEFLEPGTYLVHYIANDCVGNVSECSFNIQVNAAPEHLISNCSRDTLILLDDPTNCDTLLDGLIPIANNYCPSYSGLLGFLSPSLYFQFPNVFKVGPGSDFRTGTDAFANVDALGVLSLTGTNNGTPPDFPTGKSDTSVAYACSYIPCNGEVSFDFDATMLGGGAFRYDEAGVILGTIFSPTFTEIFTQPPSADNVSGSRIFNVVANSQICFFVRSDNRGFEDSLSISNFVFTPEPTVLEQTCGPDLTQAVGPGVYEMCYEATDCFGTSERCTFELTVRNDFTLGCKDINVSLDSLCTAVITPAMLIAGPSCTATM
ncbi:MAG: hypothetical protein IT267_01805, partial [Saprospiraceae bacterium]|nr:hypothetical protein [Saprospiraceae bacterium]